MSGIELKYLGTGAAFNPLKGSTSAYIKRENTLFLFDCGCSVYERIFQRNLLDDIERVYIYITHTHDDHVGSLASLIFHCKLIKGIMPQVFYSEHVDSYLKIVGAVEGSEFDFFSETNRIIEGINVKTLAISHTQRIPSRGFLIEDVINNDRVVFTGDTNSLPDIVFHKYKTSNGEMRYTISKVYTECSSHKSEPPVHLNIDLLKELVEPSRRADYIIAHIDTDEDEKLIRDAGFTLAEDL